MAGFAAPSRQARERSRALAQVTLVHLLRGLAHLIWTGRNHSHLCTRGAVGALLISRLGMISIGKVRDADYYLTETHADDVHRYYADNQRSGTWVGDFASEIGLSGQVDPADFRALLNGVDPRTGARLTATPVRVHAFDAAISLDKGSSIVRALGDDSTKEQFDAVFGAARDDYITFLETWAAKVRRGHAGAERHDGAGIAAAVFHHHNSREGDPQEHLHIVILNATRGPDERITGLDTKLLYQTRYTAEAVFQASFRYHAARTLGLTYGEVDRHGVAQVAGIPDAVRREFSQRRIQIEEAMEARGVSSANAARIAALATRAPKAEPIPDAVMEAQWRARAIDHDFAIADLHTFRRTPGLSVSDADLAASITEHRSHFDQLEAIRQVAIAAGDGAPLAAIEARSDEFVASPQVVPLAEGRFTTQEILQLEQRSIAIATSTSARVPVASAAAIQRAAESRPTLGDDQASLLAELASAPRRVDVVVGKAGAGKTFALDALREAYEESGHRVLGAALAARAARELQSGAGIKSTTAHSLLTGIEAGRITIDASTVVVVDEAAMVPTRTLAALLTEVDRAQAKAILVGDPKQLPEIEAGGLFAAIAHRVPTIHLTENRRQTDHHERAALDHLRAGNVDSALDHLHRAATSSWPPPPSTPAAPS